MARIPSPLLSLLARTLANDEHVIWQGRPDAWTDMMMWRFLWWIGVPWLVLVIIATHLGWIGESAFVFFVICVVMLAAPFMLYIHSVQTLFVITNRRALILRAGFGVKEVNGVAFARMDKELEVMKVNGDDVGHLNFASGMSTRKKDADYTGRYGFRCVKDVDKVRDVLEQARAG